MAIFPSSLSGAKKDIRTVGRGVQSIFLIVFTLVMTIGIDARLAYLQIVDGPKLRQRAESNRIRLILKQPERGNIFDRNGKLLASTRYPHSVYLWPMAHTKPSWSVVGRRLSPILNIPQEEMEKKLEQAGANSSSLIRIARDLNEAQLTALKEYETELPDVQINTEAADSVLQTFGSLTVGGVTFGEWNHSGFGPLGFPGAIAMSSDTFFYQVGRRVGGPTLIAWSRKYGFGRKTGIEFVNEESKGLVPDEIWKQKVFKLPWTVGDTINMSIGQGALQVTPLQSAIMFSVPANGGYRVKPHLLKDHEAAKNWRESLNMKPETIKVLRDGLRKVITEGTGKRLNKIVSRSPHLKIL